MKTKKSLLWITRTAVLIALLIVCQWGLGALTAGNQFVVGAAVNLVLIIAATYGGLACGLSVAIVSPFMAFLLSVGPKILPIIPFIAVGNAVIVVVWNLLEGNRLFNKLYYVRLVGAAVIGAGLKCGALYLLIVKLMAPFLVSSGVIKEAAANVLAASFGITQLFTALIGGALAVIVVPLLSKAIKRKA